MATSAKELKEWLGTVPDDDMIAIDEGGLTLVVYGENAGLEERKNADHDPATCSEYFEIGGVNIDCDKCGEEECVCVKAKRSLDELRRDPFAQTTSFMD